MTGSEGHVRDAPDDALLEILASGVEGDTKQREAAGTALFERWHGKVWAWCRRVLDDDELAADLTQEVFSELFRNASHYASRGRFGAWLYVVTRNRCLNERKRRSRLVGGELMDEFAAISRPEHWAEDPAERAQRGDIAERVRRACHQHLSPREQEVIWLRYRWGLKVEEIRNALGLENASGARTHLRTAERKLRRALAALRETSSDASARGKGGSWTS